MYTGQFINVTLQSDADLSAYEYRAVRISGSNLCNVASQNTVDDAIGVLMNNTATAAGLACNVAVQGVVKIFAGASAITAGVKLTHDSSGFAILATSGTMIIGTALASVAAYESLPIILQPYFSGNAA